MKDWANELKIYFLNNGKFDEQIFTVGKNQIHSIKINNENRLIEIIFEETTKSDYKIIPFESIMSFEYEEMKEDPAIYEQFNKWIDQ